MRAVFDTQCGGFEVELALDKAPATAGYFRDIIRAGAFDGAAFFRIVAEDNASLRADNPIEVVQGGLTEGDPQPAPPVRHEPTSETGLRHERWTVSTARNGPGETYGSFFICMRDEPALDFGGARHPDGLGFAAFGRVVSGFDAVEALFRRREAEEFLKNKVLINSCWLTENP